MKKGSKNQKCSLFHYFRKIAKMICRLVSLLFFLGIIFLIMRFLILAINLRFPTFSIAFPVGIQSQEDSKSEKNTPSADVSPTILSNITPEPTVAKTILPDVTPELIVVNTTTAPTVTIAPTPTSTATTAPTPTPTATIAPTPTPTATIAPTPTSTATIAPTPTSTATVAPTPIPTATATPTPFITPVTSPTPLIRITTVAPYYFSEDISKKQNETVPTNTPDVPINTPNVTSTPVCVSSTSTSTPKKMESYLSTTSVDFSQIMYNNLITQHEFTLPEKKVSVIWKNTEIIFSSSTLSLIELSISSAILDQLSQIPVEKICIQDLASIDITQLVECMHEFEGSKIILGWERDDINSPYQFRIKMDQSLFSILFHGKYNYDSIESN